MNSKDKNYNVRIKAIISVDVNDGIPFNSKICIKQRDCVRIFKSEENAENLF